MNLLLDHALHTGVGHPAVTYQEVPYKVLAEQQTWCDCFDNASHNLLHHMTRKIKYMCCILLFLNAFYIFPIPKPNSIYLLEDFTPILWCFLDRETQKFCTFCCSFGLTFMSRDLSLTHNQTHSSQPPDVWRWLSIFSRCLTQEHPATFS